MSTDLTIVGRNIDEIRKARGLSRAALARTMGCADMTVRHHIETGSMDTKTLLRYTEALGCNVSDIVGDLSSADKFKIPIDITGLYPYNFAFAMFKQSLIRIWQEENKDSEYYAPYGKKLEAIEKEAYDLLYRVHIPSLLKEIDGLTEREKQVISFRYEHMLILDECGKKFGVTRERIRQIERKAMRKLWHPVKRRNYILLEYSALEQYKNQMNIVLMQNKILEDRLKAYESLDQITEEKENAPETIALDDISIAELDLSVRSYNCLVRRDYKTIGSLRDVSREELMKIRNLGRKSYLEILDKVSKQPYASLIKFVNEEETSDAN